LRQVGLVVCGVIVVIYSAYLAYHRNIYATIN
jgi:hypothetical protein